MVDVLRHGSWGQALQTWAFLLQLPLHQAVASLNHLPDETGVGLGGIEVAAAPQHQGLVPSVKGGEKVYHRHDEKGLNWEPAGSGQEQGSAGERRRHLGTSGRFRVTAVIGAAENHIQMVLGKKDVFPRILPAKRVFLIQTGIWGRSVMG